MATLRHLTQGFLDLRLPPAGLQAIVSTQLSLSGQSEVLENINDLGDPFPHSSWIRRGRSLKLEICVTVDGKHIAYQDLNDLESTIVHAEIWSQLGLQASVLSTEDYLVHSRNCSMVAIGLNFNHEDTNIRLPRVFGICYRIPPSDVIAPSTIDTVDLEAVRITVGIETAQKRTKPCNTSKKRKHTKLDTFHANVDLPSTPPTESVVEIDTLIAVVDAGLRLSIYDSSVKCRGLTDGMVSKSLRRSASLSSIAPVIWSPGYLKAVANRASLVPTIAHAFSHFIFTNAKSQHLKHKLHDVIYFENNNGKREMEGTNVTTLVQNLPNMQRLDIVSGSVWRVMQKQLRKPSAVAKLTPLSRHYRDPGPFDDEDLFSSQDSADLGNPEEDFFDHEDMLEDGYMEEREDDELLFLAFPNASQRRGGLSGQEYHHPVNGLAAGNAEDDVILFENGRMSQGENYGVNEMMVGQGEVDESDNDELLLDLMLDDNSFIE